MACPSNATTGFQIIQGTIPQTTLESISLDTYPATLFFAPRQVPPLLHATNGVIDENLGGNTIKVNQNKYLLHEVRLCNPINRFGFGIVGAPNVAPSLELILTFYSKLDELNKTYPKLILLSIPIYESSSNQEVNATYLKQLVVSDAPAASLQSLFYQSESDTQAKSLSYKMCINLLDSNNQPYSLQAMILNFPNGCTVGSSILNALKGSTSSLITDYKIPPAILDSYMTVQYTIAPDGTRSPTAPSSEGYISSTPITVTDANFTNLFQYYLQPPRLSSKYDSNTSPASYFSTDQYKCVPLGEDMYVSDPSGGKRYVVPVNAKTMEQTLAEQQTIKEADSLTGIDWGLIGIVIVALLLLAILIVGFGFLAAYANSPTQEMVNAVTAATAAASATAAVAVAVPNSNSNSNSNTG